MFIAGGMVIVTSPGLWPSTEAPDDLVGHSGPEMRVALEKPRDVRQIHLALARPALRVHGGPDFPLQDIFHSRHGEQHAESGALFRARNEGGIAVIELNSTPRSLFSAVRFTLRGKRSIRKSPSHPSRDTSERACAHNA